MPSRGNFGPERSIGFEVASVGSGEKLEGVGVNMGTTFEQPMGIANNKITGIKESRIRRIL